VATDVGWRCGDGPPAQARGEAVLMALADRRSVLPELSGAGLAALATRLGRG